MGFSLSMFSIESNSTFQALNLFCIILNDYINMYVWPDCPTIHNGKAINECFNTKFS